MELTFEERRQKNIRNQKYIASIEIAAYMIAVIILFRFGGYVANLAMAEVSLMSVDGIIKMAAILCMLILIGIVVFPGTLIVGRDILCYYDIKDR